MKKCAACGFAETDDAVLCSRCGGSLFVQEQPADQAVRVQQQVVSNVNWMARAVATFFFPFVGGYFLLKPGVQGGYKWFGILWCLLMAAAMLSPSQYSVVIDVTASVACALPVVVYAIRVNHEKKLQAQQQQAVEQAQMEALLAQPLETFGDLEAKELEEKYR